MLCYVNYVDTKFNYCATWTIDKSNVLKALLHRHHILIITILAFILIDKIALNCLQKFLKITAVVMFPL